MKKLFSIILISLFTVYFSQSNACTNFLITKGASADGSVMISYNADSHLLYGELYHWPAADWPSGSMLDIYEWDTGKFLGQIPQVSHTYNVVGNMNEHQVAIGETTYGGRSELQHQKGAIMDYGSLIYIALQRSKTAREAIKVMTDLVQKYGYYSEGESFSVSDKNEAWIFEMIGKGEGEKGAVWVARKIPDGYICGHANQARITTFPLSDSENCMYSKDVISFARKKGLYVGDDKDFSFSDTYAPVDFEGARFCEIRVWSMFKDTNKNMSQYFNYAKGNVEHAKSFSDGRKNPNKYATNRMPLWIKPDKKITVQNMTDFMRDHLEGTPLDMRKDVGAGPFELPYRWRHLTWKITSDGSKELNKLFKKYKTDTLEFCNERATATQQTGFTFVAQSRSWLPDEIGGIIWFGVDDAASTVYTPIYSASYKVPETYAVGNGKMMEWSDNSAFWTFNQVSNFAYLAYNRIHPEIDKKQHQLEKSYQNKVKAIDAGAKLLYKTDKKAALDFITDFSVNNANNLVYQWKDFYHYLFMKYMDGNVKTPNPGHLNPHLSQPGYSEDFYRRIVKDTGEKLLVK
ncbi:MAG: C69 family dipeptidase [Bacteroidales bacterium]|nr:C69 family dipeptidase [Bacteroidales bacterium]